MQAMISQSGRGGWRFLLATVTSLAYVERRMLRRNSVALWQRIERPSAVARTSNSKTSQPWASASSIAAKEGFGARRRGVRNHRFGGGIHLDQRSAARAANFECIFLFRHATAMILQLAGCC